MGSGGVLSGSTPAADPPVAPDPAGAGVSPARAHPLRAGGGTGHTHACLPRHEVSGTSLRDPAVRCHQSNPAGRPAPRYPAIAGGVWGTLRRITAVLAAAAWSSSLRDAGSTRPALQRGSTQAAAGTQAGLTPVMDYPPGESSTG